MVEVEKIVANRYRVRAHNHVITLSAADLRELMDWCQANVRELEDEARAALHMEDEPQAYTLYWHPSPLYTSRLAYGNDTPLWGSERLEVWHEGLWIAGKVGHLHAGGVLVLWPREKEGHPEYITLHVGNRVRNVSKPHGDGGGPEQ